MEAAQELVEDRLSELAVDGGQPHDAHAAELVADLRAGVLGHAVERHLVAGLHEPRRQFLDKRVKSAKAWHTARPENHDPHSLRIVATAAPREFGEVNR